MEFIGGISPKYSSGFMSLRSALHVAEWRSSGQLDLKLLSHGYRTLSLSERLLCLPALADTLLDRLLLKTIST